MISSEVQRTLVKSAPELWSELSEPDALTRHLGALGEIRITRTEPEKLVEWEAAGTNGVVKIKPSGWGTKVTLSVTREIELPEPMGADDEPQQPEAETSMSEPPMGALAEQAPSSAAADVQADPETSPSVEIVTPAEPLIQEETTAAVGQLIPLEAEPETAVEAQPEATEPRRGFFARLFSRRRPRTATSELQSSAPEQLGAQSAEDSEVAPAASGPYVAAASSAIEALQARFAPAPTDPQPSTPEPVLEAVGAPRAPGEPEAGESELDAPEPGMPIAEDATAEAIEAPVGQPLDLAAELQAAEAVAAEEVTAVLTATLDRLGAAHHRPFSRS